MSFALQRHFTKADADPYQQVEWKRVEITGWEFPVEAPAFWSTEAVEIAATRYFRKREQESSVRALFGRVVHAIRQAGELQGYFQGETAETFAAELTHILLHQMGSFNSPVYFNVGVFPAYGCAGNAENFVWDEKSGRAEPRATAFIHPQASACFIQDVRDDLLSIFDLVKSEAKLFKYGSGTGTNFSRLRAKGEALESGGESTGLISYLEVFDKAAQAIKSGGTTRRAAKMVVLDADHPEVLEFIRWKMHEERKARVLLANGYSGGMDGEAFHTVSGQNSNNSVRVSDEFMRRAEADGDWELRFRKTGKVAQLLKAKELLSELARAAWECADPGIHFQDTIAKAHMCPAGGEIRSSNPCSEYLFLDDSACNLASLNLVAFWQKGTFNWDAFAQAARVLLLAQDILVDYASYPTAAIAENSHRYRPLGLGYANLGGLLMRMGVAYDSKAAADWTARLTGTLHALALTVSQELAATLGPFAAWSENREPGLAVLERAAAAWAALEARDLPWVGRLYSDVLAGAARTGLRNAQVTLIAPTGTIGLLMDCDTLGIEPDFSLIKRKTLAGGGEMILTNRSVKPALENLGYAAGAIEKILAYVSQNGRLHGAPGLQEKHLAVFDCAIAPPGEPKRRISAEGHLRIMAAAQPFLSGAISKTVNLPSSARVEDVEKLFFQAWKLGLKSLAIYRDGSKTLQPLCAEC